MKAIFLQDGDRCDYIPTADVKAGDVVVQGELVGVATRDIGAGRVGILRLKGIFKVKKSSGVLEVGQPAYWDGDGVTAQKCAVRLGVTVWNAQSQDSHAFVKL